MNNSLQNVVGRLRLDESGAVVSWICAVHCLAPPAIVSLLPAAGLGFLTDSLVEHLLVGLSMLIAALSFIPAFFARHRKLRAALLFVAGLSMILLADAVFEDNFYGRLASIACGALFITAAHLLNRRLCRSCIVCRGTTSHSAES